MKNIKKKIALLLYRLILILVKMVPAKKGANHLLIIKTDEIGDYVLFHSYLKYFKSSERYKRYKITLVGNKAWKEIFETYDAGTVDNTIWLDKKQYKSNLSYRFAFLKQIRKSNASDVINFIFSRSINDDDAIAWASKAGYKVAMKGDDTNRQSDSDNQDEHIYSEIIDAGNVSLFDTIRNRNFACKLLNEAQLSIETFINVKRSSLWLPDNYFVMFLGAGNQERKWPPDYFIQSAEYVRSKYGLTPMICGGPGDVEESEEFVRMYGKEIVNYAGKTNLLQLIELLSKAKFLICVDTGALHIAAAVRCPVVGLYSGKFHGRFAPYPKEITDQFYPVYPDFADELIAKNDPVLYDTAIMKNDTIKLIPPKKIVPFIDKILCS